MHPVMIAFYNRLKDKGKNGKVIVLCDYAETGSRYLWSPESGKKYDPNYKPAFA